MEIITENRLQQNIVAIKVNEKIMNRTILRFLFQNRFLIKINFIDYEEKDIETLKKMESQLDINLDDLKDEIKDVISSYVRMGLCAPISNFRNNSIDNVIIDYIKYLIDIYHNIGVEKAIDSNTYNVMLHSTDEVERFLKRYEIE